MKAAKPSSIALEFLAALTQPHTPIAVRNRPATIPRLRVAATHATAMQPMAARRCVSARSSNTSFAAASTSGSLDPVASSEAITCSLVTEYVGDITHASQPVVSSQPASRSHPSAPSVVRLTARALPKGDASTRPGRRCGVASGCAGVLQLPPMGQAPDRTRAVVFLPAPIHRDYVSLYRLLRRIAERPVMERET